MTSQNLIATIDAFGDLKADIADLEVKLQAMKDSLADLKAGAYEGQRYRLNVLEGPVERIDWKQICEKLRQSMIANANSLDDLNRVNEMWTDMKAAHSTVTQQRAYRIGARNGRKVV